MTTGSEDGTFKLGSIVPTGWDYEDDELRTIKPANAGTSVSMYYLDAATAQEIGAPEAGWYDGEGNCYSDTTFSLAAGFLTCLYNNISFTYSGEVYQDEFAAKYYGKTKGEKFNVFPNPIPTPVKLGSIVPSGWNYENDELRLLKSANAGTLRSVYYLDKTTAQEIGAPEAGWYDGEGNCYNDEIIEPGDGFLTCLYSDVTIVFPAAVAAQ